MHYSLVYVLFNGDERVPLVLSQTFDQAYSQVVTQGSGKPVQVEVWYYAPMRTIFSSREKKFLNDLRKRYPGLNIYPLYGIQRFNDALSGYFFNLYRRRIKEKTVIFHCRQDASHMRIRKLMNRAYDKSVIDVRGAWWDERFDRLGIDDIRKLNEDQRTEYEAIMNRCLNECEVADGIVAVNDRLSSFLSNRLLKKKEINTVPCGTIKSVSSFKNRELRERLRLEDSKNIIVYSGGYARYQHLEDLTIPFVKELVKISDDIHFLVLTYKADLLSKILRELNFPLSRVSIISVRQDEVVDILSGCNLGLLIRKPTNTNLYAQPVKVGEYLAAGVPICYHKGVSGVSELIDSAGAGVEIDLEGYSQDQWKQEALRVVNYLQNSINNKLNALKLANSHFLWKKQVVRQRQYYLKILHDKQWIAESY